MITFLVGLVTVTLCCWSIWWFFMKLDEACRGNAGPYFAACGFAAVALTVGVTIIYATGSLVRPWLAGVLGGGM